VVDTETPLDAKAAREILSQAAGVEVWDHDERGPNLRAAAGREVTLVGRVRSDGTPTGGLQLWLAADLLRLAGHNAVKLLAERFGDA
jgi:aspartate-semialdehyde dehydrogenase